MFSNKIPWLQIAILGSSNDTSLVVIKHDTNVSDVISSSINISNRSVSSNVNSNVNSNTTLQFAQTNNLLSSSRSNQKLVKRSGNRTLVIIIGNLRGGESAWNTLYEQVLDPNMADLALSIGASSSTEKKNTSLHDRAKFVWEHEEYTDWANAIDLIQGRSWRTTLLPQFNESGGVFSGARGIPGSGAVIFMARWFLSKHLSEKLLKAYDRFVVTRSDHYYKCQHDISQLDLEYLWTPDEEGYSGVTDRHLVSSSSNILRALDIYPSFLKNNGCGKEPADSVTNPEWLIGCRWEQEGFLVKTFPRIMFTCAQETDDTRWQQHSKFTVPEGVHLKYLTEYTVSLTNCMPNQGWPESFNQKGKRGIACRQLGEQFLKDAWRTRTGEMSKPMAAEIVMAVQPMKCNKYCRTITAISQNVSKSLCPNDLSFCPDCTWHNTRCGTRAMYLIIRQGITPKEAIDQLTTGDPPLACINAKTKSMGSNPALTKKAPIKTQTKAQRSSALVNSTITVDVMSIGSQKRLQYQRAQHESWASHSSVRNFYSITEVDDRDPHCALNMSREQVGTAVEQCRHWFLKGALNQYRYPRAVWVLQKEDPAGWMCAQSRWGNGLAKLARQYDQDQNGTLPDFFMIVHDDTLVRMDMFVQEMQGHGVDPYVPMVWAGCLNIARKQEGVFRFSPAGGGGIVLSRGALERFFRPLYCNDKDHTATTDMAETCTSIKQNLIREDLDWKDGMSLVDLLAAVSNRIPNCFLADQLLAHFFNYYDLAEPWVAESAFEDYPYSRIHPLPNTSISVLEENPEEPIPLSRAYSCLGAERIGECTALSPWCHNMDDKAMLRDAAAKVISR